MIQLGGCHWQRADPLEEKAHLWVVVSSPGDEGFVHVNFTTPGGRYAEETCRVSAMQCAQLRHESCVAYSKIEILLERDYVNRTRQGLLDPDGRTTPQVVRAIQDGALRSENVAGRYRRLIRASLVDASQPWEC